MTTKPGFGIAAAVAATIAFAASGPSAADQPTVVHSIDMRVPLAPRVATVNGIATLVHELHLNSFSPKAIIIDRIELWDDGQQQALAKLPGTDLATSVGSPLSDAGTLTANGRAILYVNLPLPGKGKPTTIRHRLHFRFADDGADVTRSVEGAVVALDSQALARLGPPLRGGPWIAVYDPEMAFGHRRMILATHGAARIPGRFAIDYFGVDSGGRTVLDDSGRMDRHGGYGAEVLAVADATVSAARDDVAEAATTKERKRVALADETGNYIALDLGNGHFAFYEHLQPGLLVKRGDRVRRGQVIARLGLTGSGSQPHLHFHVANANSPLGGEGLPYCIAAVEMVGSYPTIQAAFEGKPWQAGAIRPTDEHCLPAPNSVVRFPE